MTLLMISLLTVSRKVSYILPLSFYSDEEAGGCNDYSKWKFTFFIILYYIKPRPRDLRHHQSH